MKIYWDEELQKFQEAVNMLYLQQGNLKEILHMNYWRFKSILRTLEKKNCIESGRPYIERGLPQSSKDMIARKKAQNEKERKNG